MATTIKKSTAKKSATKKPNSPKAKKPAAKKQTVEKTSVLQTITDRIIAMMQDVIDGKAKRLPWQIPWSKNGIENLAISGATKKPYSFLNQMLLGKAGEWYTFKQIQEKNAKLKKGSHHSKVVFFSWVDDKSKEPDENGKYPQIPIFKIHQVFHTDDIVGIEPTVKPEKEESGTELQPDEKAEAVVNGYVRRSGVKLNIRKSTQAYYSPSTDEIVVPEMSQYKSVPEFYSTLFHEMTHSTGHESRLNRINSTKFASHEYSKEELVAEMGAASLVNYCGLETDGTFNNSVAYIEAWIERLKNDNRMAVSAANQAEKAFRMIVGDVADVEKENESAA